MLPEIEVNVLDYVLSGEVSRVQSLAETQLGAEEVEEAKSSKDKYVRGISLVGDEEPKYRSLQRLTQIELFERGLNGRKSEISCKACTWQAKCILDGQCQHTSTE